MESLPLWNQMEKMMEMYSSLESIWFHTGGLSIDPKGYTFKDVY